MKFIFYILFYLLLLLLFYIFKQINVGCTDKFEWESGVYLEYSHDAGVTWNLVQEQCYSGSECDGSAHEASVYFSGFYGKWRRVLLPVTHHLAQKCVPPFSLKKIFKYTVKLILINKYLRDLNIYIRFCQAIHVFSVQIIM